MKKSAKISPCGNYRYRLDRVWGDGPQRVCWVMLNPSTADAEIDDPTIRRCISFSRLWGADGLIVVNLFAWRATNPRDLAMRSSLDNVGPLNDLEIAGALMVSNYTVCAWGSPSDAYLRRLVKHRAGLVSRLLLGLRAYCLGTAKDGMPRHPLYIKSDTEKTPWRMHYSLR